MGREKKKALIITPYTLLAHTLATFIKEVAPEVATTVISSWDSDVHTLHDPQLLLLITDPLQIHYDPKLLYQIKKRESPLFVVSLQTTLNTTPHLNYLFDQTITPLLEPEQVKAILKQFLHPAKSTTPQPTLTAREIEVMRLLVVGNTMKEIAAQLSLSVHTVHTHRKNLSQKLGIRSVAGMAIYAAAHHYIDPKAFFKKKDNPPK